jgi:hypothetical protein
MNELQLKRLFRRLALLSAPLPLAVLGAACGGSAISDSPDSGGSTATGGKDAGSAGAAANGGLAYGGAGGAVVATSGASSAGAAAAGASGFGGASGEAGASGGPGGSSGPAGAGACQGTVPAWCGGGPIIVPKTCVDPSLAVATTQLPIETCRSLCNSAPTLISCTVTTVAATSITVRCSTGCFTG